MPLLLVPPPTVLFDAIESLTKIKPDESDFHSSFFKFCNFVVDSEELFRLMESAYTSVTMVMWAKITDKLGQMYTRWMEAYENDRLGVGAQSEAAANQTTGLVAAEKEKEAAPAPALQSTIDEEGKPQVPQARPSSYDIITILESLKLLQCMRGIDCLAFPPTLMLHPDPVVRYHVVVSSSANTIQFALHSPELAEVRRVAVRGNEDQTTGAQFSPLIDLIKKYEAFRRNHPKESPPEDLVEQIWWSRLRLQVICMYGHRLGRFCTQQVVEENPAFFTAELMCICAYAAAIAASNDELICGVLSDLFAVFELGFLDFSLFPTPEVLHQNWKNVCRIFDPDLHATFRTHGLMAYGVLRGLQFSGGFLTRHEPTAIAKVKLAILKHATVDEPVGRFAFTISQSMEEFLGNGLFETIVHLFHKFIRALLDHTPTPVTANEEASYAQVSERFFLKVLRLNVIANIVEYIFNTAPGHPTVSPVVFLSHRMSANDTPQQELLPELLQLYARFPEFFGIALRLVSWCSQQNPRDVTHRLIDLDILGKLGVVFDDASQERLKTIKLDLDGGTPLEIVAELSLRLVTEGLSGHEDAREYAKKHLTFFARALLTPFENRYYRLLLNFSQRCDESTKTSLVLTILANIKIVPMKNIFFVALLTALFDPSGPYGTTNVCAVPEIVRQRLLPVLEQSLEASDQIEELVIILQHFPASEHLPTLYLPALIRMLSKLDGEALQKVLFTQPEGGFGAQTLLTKLLCMKFVPSVFHSAAAPLKSLWRILSEFLSHAASTDECFPALSRAFQIVRSNIAVLELDRDVSFTFHPEVDAYLVEWALETFNSGITALARVKSQTNASEASGNVAPSSTSPLIVAVESMLYGFSSRWGFGTTTQGGMLGMNFIGKALEHPQLRASGAMWKVVAYAARTLKEVAIHIKEMKEKLQKAATDPVPIESNSKKSKRGRSQRQHTSKRGAPSDDQPPPPISEDEREKLVHTISLLESYFIEILTALEPFALNETVSADSFQFMNTFTASSIDIDPFSISASIQALDDDFKMTVLSGFQAKFQSDEATRACSIPVASIVFAMFECIPQAATVLYRRQVDVLLPELLTAMNDKPFEDAMTFDHMLRVHAIALCFVHYHAWKEDEGERELTRKELPGERLTRLRNTAAWQDELALCKLFSATVRLVAEWQRRRKTTKGTSDQAAVEAEAKSDVDKGIEALQSSVMNTISTLCPKFYAATNLEVWLEANRIAQLCTSLRGVRIPSIDLFFCERPSLQACHYRWAARKVFQRLRNVPAAAENHLRINLSDIKLKDNLPASAGRRLKESLESFAVDADVFFAEMKRTEVDLELGAVACAESLRKFLTDDLNLICIPSRSDPFVLRPFIVLVAPLTCNDILTTQESEAILTTLRAIWPDVRDDDYQPTHHTVLRGLTSVPRSDWPQNPVVSSHDDPQSIAKSFLPITEDLAEDSFVLLATILDLVPDVAAEEALAGVNIKKTFVAHDPKSPKANEFDGLLSRYYERFESFFRSVNSNFISFYIQENQHHNAILVRLLEALRDHSGVFRGRDGMRQGTQTLLYLVRLWTSGSQQSRNLEPKLMLDALANPVDEEEEDDDAYSDDEDDEEGEDEPSEPVFKNAVESPSSAEEGGAAPPRTPEVLGDNFTKSLLAFVPDVSDIIEILSDSMPPSMQSTQPDISPYHFYPPPKNMDDVEYAVFWNKQVSLEDYVTILAQYLTEHDKLREEAFINIASAAVASNSYRLRVTAALLAALEHPTKSTNLKAPLVLNACLTIAAPVVTGMRRTFDAKHVLEISSENRIRLQMLQLLLSSLSKVSSFYRQKIVSLLLRVITQTHVTESEAIESTWSKELPAETCHIPMHDHLLDYISVGETDAVCFLCRETSAFYHYGCTTCRQFACCLACKVRCTDPNESFSALPIHDMKIPINRLMVVFSQASVDELNALLESILTLVAQPSFPCERSDGAMLFVDAVLRASLDKQGAFLRLTRSALDVILPETSKLLARRRSRLHAIATDVREDVNADDAALLGHLARADFSHDECETACYLHHFIPIVLEHAMTAEGRAQLSVDDTARIQTVVQQMIDTVVLTMETLSPAVSRLKCRDAPFSSSPANVILFAVTARSIAAMGPDVHFEIPEFEEQGMARTTSSGSFLMMNRTETQALVADSNEASVIFKQVVPNFKDRAQVDQTHYVSQQLSSVAMKHRGLINLYLRNSESPSQILDTGLSSLLDVSHLDFAVRERLFRSRLEEQAVDRIDVFEMGIERENFLLSTLAALGQLREILKKGIVEVKVQFDSEESVDEGGVTREWITLFFQEIVKDGRALRRVGDCYEINPYSFQESKADVRMAFESIGIAIGLALSQGVPIEPHFTRALYRHMIGWQPTLADLEFSDPELFRSLMAVNRMTTDDEFEGLCQYFTIVGDDDKEVELMPGGAQLQVCNANKKQYIKMLADFVMTNRVHKRVKSFLIGISRWFPLTWLTTFSADEMELVCCGMSEIDVEDWRTHTRYEGYNASTPQVRWFWDLVEVMSSEDRARLLQFTRGSSKVPAAGFAALTPPFTISSTGSDDARLPSSHTCYNQLEIPQYSTAEILRDKLLRALEFGAVGFGFA